MKYKIVIEYRNNKEYVYLYKRGWFGWKIHQYDIPVSYSYFTSIKELQDWFTGMPHKVYPEYFTYLAPIKPIGYVYEFSNILDLMSTNPELFI